MVYSPLLSTHLGEGTPGDYVRWLCMGERVCLAGPSRRVERGGVYHSSTLATNHIPPRIPAHAPRRTPDETLREECLHVVSCKVLLYLALYRMCWSL